MQHTAQTFELKTTSGKTITVATNEFNFELKEILEKRFGTKKLEQFLLTGKLEHSLKLDEVINDMPLLLKNLPKNIDYKKSNFDTFYKIYFFFIAYERNVNLRLIESEAQTLASVMKDLQETIASNPAIILALNFKKDTVTG